MLALDSFAGSSGPNKIAGSPDWAAIAGVGFNLSVLGRNGAGNAEGGFVLVIHSIDVIMSSPGISQRTAWRHGLSIMLEVTTEASSASPTLINTMSPLLQTSF